MIKTAEDFGALLEMFREEIGGLTDGQLDWDDSSEEWSEWSIRRQLSHVALVYLYWIPRVWGKVLWPEDPPAVSLDFRKANAYDRRLDEEVYWKLEDIWPKFEEGFEFVKKAMEGRSEEEMNTLTVKRTFGSDLQMGKTDLKVYHYWAYVSSFHPDGLTQDPADETAFIFTLAGMVRTLYWEALTHLRTIQRLKIAQGLAPAVEIPREGYLMDPFFWGPGDEPEF
ncbi:MAG: hypothetical protein V3U53_05520 [bacterium]